MSVGPCVPLLSGGTRFQLSRSALGLSTLRAPSNAGCASLGARVPAPLYAGPGISRPRAGALSPQAVLSVVSDQVSAACAEWLEESTEGEPSGACVVLRAFRQLRAVLRALTFSALGAPPEDRKGGKIGRFSAAGHTQNTLYFGPSMLSCVSVFDRKNRRKSFFKETFALPEYLPRVSPSAVKLHIM